MTRAQRELMRKHGRPAEFERAVYAALGEISLGEAHAAIAKYRSEWRKAGLASRKKRTPLPGAYEGGKT